MVHFAQSMMPDVPLTSSLPTTFTFHPNSQHDEQSTLQQQQSLPTTSQNSSTCNAQLSSNDDRNTNQQAHGNDYETRLRYNESIPSLDRFFFFFLGVQIAKHGSLI